MDRSVILELKDIRNEILNIHESFLEPQVLFSKIDEIKKRLKSLMDSQEMIDKGYGGRLSTILNSGLPNAEMKLKQGSLVEFKNLLMGQVIRALDPLIIEVEMEEIFSEKYEYKQQRFIVKVFRDDRGWNGKGFLEDGEDVPNTGVYFESKIVIEAQQRGLLNDPIEEIVKLVKESLRIQVDQKKDDRGALC